MNLSESTRSSIAEIWGHKLRSCLTLVGIVLGTTSLVVMVSRTMRVDVWTARTAASGTELPL